MNPDKNEWKIQFSYDCIKWFALLRNLTYEEASKMIKNYRQQFPDCHLKASNC